MLYLYCFNVFLCASYETHITMSKNEHYPYDFVKFNTFIKEFDKYKDDSRLKICCNGRSIFLRVGICEIVYLHASIVRFNEKCMIFYPTDWFKYCIWKRNFTKLKPNRVKGLWDN